MVNYLVVSGIMCSFTIWDWER